MTATKMDIADVVAHQQAKLGLTNSHIAKSVGFKTQNIVSMIKRREMNLPMRKVMPVARVLDIDPVQFAMQWSQENDVGMDELIDQISKQPALTTEQIKLVKEVSAITGGLEIDLFSAENAAELEKIKAAISVITQRKLERMTEMLKVQSMLSVKDRKIVEE